MSCRRTVHALIVLCASLGALSLAPAVLAATGPGSGGAGFGAVPPSAPPQSGNGVVSASGDGISITSHASALLNGRLRVTGSSAAAPAGATVQIERLGRETHWKWAVTAVTTLRSDRTFAALWHVNHIGRFQLRAVVINASQSRAAAASPTVTVISYRPSVATIYGPGLYGDPTACGQTLTRHTVGVANRTLPCGSKVALYFRGRTLVVPVIDRGPYANGADWDLTTATAARLGVTGTSTLGAVSLPPGS